MEPLTFLCALAIAICDGLALGFASGIALQGNASAVEGVDPPFSNSILRLLFRRADNLTLLSGLAYLLAIAASLPFIFALLMLPGLAVAWLSLPETKLVFGCLFGAMFVAMLPGKVLGTRWWNRKIDSQAMAGE